MKFLGIAVTAACLAAWIPLLKRRGRSGSFLIRARADSSDGQLQFTAHLLPSSASQSNKILLSNSAVLNAQVVGIDCEWQPERGKQHNPVALLQLAVQDECFLAPLLLIKDGVPTQLQYLLQDPLVIKVGVGIKEDVRRLAKEYGIVTRSALDIADVIRAFQPALLQQHGSSLAGLSRALLGIKVDKSLQCSDWGAARLSKQQLKYAALDACLSLKLVEQLHQLLISQQRAAGNKSNCSSSVTAAAEVPNDLAAFLAPFVLKQTSSYGTFKIQGAANAGPLLPCRRQQQQQQQHLQEPLLLFPWLLPAVQGIINRQAEPQLGAVVKPQQPAHALCAMGQEQQRRPAQNPCATEHLIKPVYQYALQQLHLHQYFKAFPELQQHVQQCYHQTKQRQQQQRAAGSKQLVLQQLQQERRQRQLLQLQRLGHSAAAPHQNIFSRMQKLKPARLPTRKTLQYENCRILGPDGKALATCGIKKVRWYLDRNLADLVEESPSIAIRLNFTPRGSGHADDEYYLSDKDNRCVVCGHEGDYLRHSVVPHCYRQHFPAAMKSHLSHDVVLLCVGCHQICNILDQKKMSALGRQYGAPLQDESRRFKIDRQLAKVCSAGKALASTAAAGNIPPARILQLQQVIMQHFAVTEWRPELIAMANAAQPKKQDETWESHAAVVVKAVVAAGQQQQQQQQDSEAISKQQESQQCTENSQMQQQQQQQQHRGASSARGQQQVAGAESQVRQHQQQQQQEAEHLEGCPQKQQCRSIGKQQEERCDVLKEADSSRYQQQQQQLADTAICPIPQAVQHMQASWDVQNATTCAALLQQQLTVIAGAGAVAALLGFATTSNTDSITGAVAQCFEAFGIASCCDSSSSSETCCSSPHDGLVRVEALSDKAAAARCSNFNQAACVFGYGFNSAWLAAVASAAATATAGAAVSGPSSSSTLASQQQQQQPQGISAEPGASGDGSSSSKIILQHWQQQHSNTAKATGSAAAAAAAITAAEEAALGEFIRDWRRHFLEAMQPRYLPPFWSVNARVKNSSETDMPPPEQHQQMHSSKHNCYHGLH